MGDRSNVRVLRPGDREDLENVWDSSDTPLATVPLSSSFGVHSASVPEERPSRRKRLCCFGLLTTAVLAVVVASVVVGIRNGGSPAAGSISGDTSGSSATAGLSGSSTSSGGSERNEDSGSGTESGSGTGGSSTLDGSPAPTSDGGGGGGGKSGAPAPEGSREESSSSPGGGGGGETREQGALPPAAEASSGQGGAASVPDASDDDDSGNDDDWSRGWAGDGWPGHEQAPAPESEGQAEGGSKQQYSVRFLAVGDWGRQGLHNQTEVAELMGRVAGTKPPAQFIVSTGDNFYQHGLQSASDPLFEESFANVYTAPSLQVPWYAVLGNHDYCDSAPNCAHGTPHCKYSPLHQMSPTLANREANPRWHLRRSYTHMFADGRTQIFFIDTNPFIKKYYDKSNSWSQCPGGLWTQNWQEHLMLLETDLAASTADWKLVVGHHPTYSNGHHGNNTELIQHLQPLFKKYGVQAYFTGHDHNLEHLSVEGYNIIISGAGSETDREQLGSAYSHYYHPYSGFVSVLVAPNELVVEFYTLEGDAVPAHTTRIMPSGDSA